MSYIKAVALVFDSDNIMLITIEEKLFINVIKGLP